jgi:hypothetical protein
MVNILNNGNGSVCSGGNGIFVPHGTKSQFEWLSCWFSGILDHEKFWGYHGVPKKKQKVGGAKTILKNI